MQGQSYSNSLKLEMVRRLTGPDALSVSQLAMEVVPSQSILYKWLAEARRMGVSTYCRSLTMTTPSHSTRTAAEKLRLVIAAEHLEGSELGMFLRQQGLHQAELTQWKQAMLGAVDAKPNSVGRAKGKQPMSRAAKARIKQLERELTRKEKALAEAAALLILQKKVQALWGEEE